MGKKKSKIVKNNQTIKIFRYFCLFFLQFLTFCAHKLLNMGKIEKLWQNLNFRQFCAHFDGFMWKINFLPFLANMARKQTNNGQN